MVAVWQNGICNLESRTTFMHRHTEGVLFCAPDPIKAVIDKKRIGQNGFIQI